MMRRWLTSLCLASLLGTAQAETLNLQQAVARALDRDPRISEKDRYVDFARAQLREARGAKGWMFDLNSFVGLAPTVRGGLFESIETQPDGSQRKVLSVTPDAFQVNGLSPWYYLDLKIIKPLYTFGKVEHYSKAAAGNIQIKRGDVQLARGQTVLDVTRAYNGFLAARDTRLLFEDVLGRLEGAISLVSGWLKRDEGGATQSDLYALQTGEALAQRYLAEARGYEDTAMAGLRMLVGTEPEEELQVADKRLEPVPLPEGSLESLKAKALVQRPEMLQVEAGLEARRELMLAKRSASMPDIYTGVLGSLSYAPLRDNAATESAIFDPFYSAGMTPVLGLKWEWAGGRQSAQEAQAKAELDATLEMKAQARLGIPYQVAEEYHAVHAHHEMVQRLYEGSRAGRRWMISSYSDFEAGVERADKVVSAFLGYIQAYSDYLKVVNDYNLHVARLGVVTGEIQ